MIQGRSKIIIKVIGSDRTVRTACPGGDRAVEGGGEEREGSGGVGVGVGSGSSGSGGVIVRHCPDEEGQAVQEADQITYADTGRVASLEASEDEIVVEEVKMEAEDHLAREYVQEFVLDHLDPADVKREVSLI